MRKMTLSAPLVVFTTLALGASQASAGGFYAGVSLGQSQIEADAPGLGGFNDPTDVELDDDDFAYKVYGGFRFSLLAAELGIVDLGAVSGLNDSAEIELQGVSGFGMIHWGLGPVSVFAKSGLFLWDAQATVNIAGTTVEADDDGTDVAYGIGAQVSLLALSARVEYEFFNIGDGFGDVSMTSIGLGYRF